MKRYIAENQTAGMMYAGIVYVGILILGVGALALEGAIGTNLVLMAVLALCAISGLHSTALLARRLKMWVEVHEDAVVFGNGRDGRAIAFDSIRGVEVLSKGRAIRLTTAEGTHKFDIAVEGVESLLSDILLRLNAGRCAVNFRSVEQALEAIRDRSEPPTAKRVFASAMLGTLVMGATYIAFVMLLPYIL